LCTLLIVGAILPQPQEKDHDLTLSVSVWNGTDGKGSVAVQKKFHREERGWGTLFTPLGLIPFPGESDFPKQSFSELNDHGCLYNLTQIAQQVATGLAKMIDSKEPEFWTAAPIRPQQPGYIPGTPLTTPPILPPPSETVVPF
jgi:hypothetical protein